MQPGVVDKQKYFRGIFFNYSPLLICFPGFWDNSESESEADPQHMSKEATLKSKEDNDEDDDFDFEFYD